MKKNETSIDEETIVKEEAAETAETAKCVEKAEEDAAVKKRKSLYAKLVGFAVIVGISIGLAAFDINLATVGHDLFVRIFNIATSTSDEETDEVTYTTTPLEESETSAPTEEASPTPEATKEGLE